MLFLGIPTMALSNLTMLAVSYQTSGASVWLENRATLRVLGRGSPWALATDRPEFASCLLQLLAGEPLGNHLYYLSFISLICKLSMLLSCYKAIGSFHLYTKKIAYIHNARYIVKFHFLYPVVYRGPL